jgi:hypothetical protein
MTVKENRPAAWKGSSTYGKFYEGGIGNSGLRNHSPPSVQPWLSHKWFAFLWTHEGAPERTKISKGWTQRQCQTGYPVGMKPFTLLASLICQDDERSVHVRRDYLDKCASGNSDMYFFTNKLMECVSSLNYVRIYASIVIPDIIHRPVFLFKSQRF